MNYQDSRNTPLTRRLREFELGPQLIPGRQTGKALQDGCGRRQYGEVSTVHARERCSRFDPQAVRHLLGLTERALVNRQNGNIEAGVEAHGIGLGSYPVIEVSRLAEIAE